MRATTSTAAAVASAQHVKGISTIAGTAGQLAEAEAAVRTVEKRLTSESSYLNRSGWEAMASAVSSR